MKRAHPTNLLVAPVKHVGAPRGSSVRDIGAVVTTISTVVLYSHPPQTISTTTTAVLTISSIVIAQTTTTAAVVTVTAGPATVTVMTSTVTFFSYAQVISASTTSSGLVTITSTTIMPATACANNGISARRLGRPVHKYKQPWEIKGTDFPESGAKGLRRGIRNV
jgi:hypothetical protein